MNKTYIIGLTGWWSDVFWWLRAPINLVFKDLRDMPNKVLLRRVWKDYKALVKYVMERFQPGDKVIILGHSYGASAGTKAAAELNAHGIEVDLFISEDQGLDSFVIVDVPIGKGVLEVDEYHVAFERLTFVKGYPKARRHFYDVSDLPGSHTSTFTQPAMVKRIADRIRGMAVI